MAAGCKFSIMQEITQALCNMTFVIIFDTGKVNEMMSSKMYHFNKHAH